jgi:succinyl-CoA synthetase beta subunit
MQKIYTEKKAEDFLKKYFPITKSILSKNFEQALIFSKKIKFPVVLKIISDQAIHKSVIGGVEIAYNNNDLKIKYSKLKCLVKQKKLELDGILIQEFIKGIEIILGGKRDPTFGPVVLFGAGGINTEILKDTSLRICPIKKKDALEMINETKISKVIKNKNLIVKLILKVSEIMMKHQIKELDINPLMVSNKKAVIADARIIFY